MSVTFWGVRGSTPVPGPDTARYGGNTPCVEVRAGDSIFVLDAGTASTSATDAIKIAAGHSWYANLPNTTVADIHAISSASTVTCVVAALLDDVA